MNTQQKLRKYLEEIEKNDQKGKKINAFLELRDEKELFAEAKAIDEKIKKGKAGKLAGQIIAVKANINVLGLHASCASKTLENYKATYNATVIKKIKEEDGLIIGMTNMDEFACGSSGESSAFGPTKNPAALKSGKELIPGGSSSGSAAAVAAGFCDMALGSDTGGSIRNPSSHCGVVGLKPSYGVVSRYGLIDLSMSLDQIGPITKSITDAALLLSVIQGKDEKDAISIDSEKIDLNSIKNTPAEITIGIPDLDGINVDGGIKELIEKKLSNVTNQCNWNIKKVRIEHIGLAVETYYPLVYVEFFSATRRFDGRRYGLKIEKNSGPEVLRRILGGSEISKAEYHGRYYHLALRAKKLIEKEFERVFREEMVDCIVLPTVPRLPHEIGKKISLEEMYGYDALTIPSNLAGNCAISVPAGEIDYIPVGIQIVCDRFQEQKMLQIAREFENSQ